MLKGKGCKPAMTVWDLWVLRQQCMRNHLADECSHVGSVAFWKTIATYHNPFLQPEMQSGVWLHRYSKGGLFICERIIKAATHAAHQANVFSQDAIGYFSRTVAGLIGPMLQERGFVDTEYVYWTVCMAHHEEENETTATTDCWAAEDSYSAWMGKYSTC